MAKTNRLKNLIISLIAFNLFINKHIYLEITQNIVCFI